MPHQMPTTLRPRISRSSPRRKPPPRVPNRPPWFPTSTPPPGPSAHLSGFSIRSQQGSISFNPTAFKAPVRTSVATEFNSGEHRYSTINPRLQSIGNPRQLRYARPRTLGTSDARLRRLISSIVSSLCGIAISATFYCVTRVTFEPRI